MEPVDHIAVVDDDPSIRELLAEQLTRQGVRVSAVASGRTLREERPEDEDAALTGLLQQIDLRAAVELAKAEARRGSV